MGGLTLTAFFALAASGALLLLYYIPSPQEAYGSVLFIEEHVAGGRFIRGLHRSAGYLMLIFIFLHTLRVLLTGAFVFRRYNWVIGMILLVLVMCSGYTGYLLPMDQLSYWAAQTGMGIIGTLPFGEHIQKMLTPDGIGGKLSLIRFYALHALILPLLITLFTVIHFYRIRKDKGVLPYL
jgi:quinol-cytochrome oxidoreductase complex cytochrome b subunit